MTAINPFLFGDWTTLDTKEWLGMSVLAVVIIVGSFFTAIAYQNGRLRSLLHLIILTLRLVRCGGFWCSLKFRAR